jgi:hypothetical protein
MVEQAGLYALILPKRTLDLAWMAAVHAEHGFATTRP